MDGITIATSTDNYESDFGYQEMATFGNCGPNTEWPCPSTEVVIELKTEIFPGNTFWKFTNLDSGDMIGEESDFE